MLAKSFYKCVHCGKIFPAYGMDETPVRTLDKGVRYACKACSRRRRYHEEETPRTPQVTGSKSTSIPTTIGFEVECGPYSAEDRAFLLNGLYNFRPERDGSLPSGYEEFVSGIRKSLSGVSAMFTSIAEHADLTHPCCGQHVNIGVDGLTPADMQDLRDDAVAVFSAVLDEIALNNGKAFGRAPNDYAMIGVGLSHDDRYYVFNLEHDNRIEFRLCKFQTAEQYKSVCAMCDEMVKAIWRLYWRNEKRHELRVKAASKALVKIYRAYSNGEGAAQKPERNNSKRNGH